MAKARRRTFNWYSPNTYDRNFKEVPENPGVYVFRVTDLESKKKEIVYVGSSSNLFERYKAHPVKRMVLKMSKKPIHIEFLFKEVNEGWYQHEIALIKKLKPHLNTHHKLCNA